MAMSMDKTFDDSVADCTTCLDLNREYLRRQWRSVGGLFAAEAPYSFTLKLLEESRKSTSCAGCALIHRAASRIKEDLGLGFRNAVLEFLEHERGAGLSLTLTMLHPVHTQPGEWERAQENPEVKVSIHTGPSKQSPNREWEHRISSPTYEIFLPLGEEGVTETASHPLWSGILSRPSRCGDTEGEAALQFTRLTLEHCRDNHLECNLDESSWRLPTRVLDLGERPDQLTADIKLYVTHNEPEAYVCLSHCWGTDRGVKPLETTRKTMDEFQQGISYGSLPKTFQDAVVFTRKLGYRFLWIDSLCIVQDDSEDWLREAGRMASIYENAVLTLAAAASPDSQGGLFRKSSPEVPLGHPGQEGIQPAMRRFSNPAFFEYGHRPSSLAKPGSDGVSPLMKRAWIYQERMLSRRVLFFTPLELVFECRESNQTESGYPWIDSRPKHAFTSIYNPDCPKDSVSALWHKLVVEYTQLKLTLNKDKLSALAGVASRLFKRLNGGQSISYLAGCWRETFIEDLLWETSPYTGDTAPRVNGDFPSWSWARSDQPKTYSDREYNMSLCQLQEAVCVPLESSGNESTGVSSGYAVLSGYLLPAKMTSTGVLIDKNPRVSHIPGKDFDWNDGGPGKVNDGDELFVLPLLASQETQHDIQIHALVLRRSSAVDGAFTRIGVFGMPISIHHLQGHHYIFEGSDMCLDMYKSQIAYGQSLLGENGIYRTPGEEPANPRWLAPEAENLERDFMMQARYRHSCLYGPKSEVKIDDFLGRMHLNMLEDGMRNEEDRVNEWRRREVVGEEQVCRRSLIKLV